MPESVTAFFLPVEPGHRFCIYHPPAGGVRSCGGMVYLHPFAEEMHKTRRMAALQARRLARNGWHVLQIDLLGCGDSSGDFGDARWPLWQSDVRAAVRWLAQRIDGPVSLWGLRLGAMLAVDVACGPGLDIDRLLLWQPVINGDQFLTQFLRLNVAAEMLSGGAAQVNVQVLREALARGHNLEVGGYELAPELAAAIDALRLGALVPAAGRVHWLELAGGDEPRISPASARAVGAWRAAGIEVRDRAVAGEPFWSTLEIVECDALLDATDEAMSHR